ncbi:MAG: hypothetical protein J07HX5_01607 [halophilic archaeon J07HX5]|nr:MAG: hypothetical protein J07HX5_01607 [halophilic archaeon J07HX5]
MLWRLCYWFWARSRTNATQSGTTAAPAGDERTGSSPKIGMTGDLRNHRSAG